MTNSLITHADLLQRQLGELFKAVNDRGIHRSKYNDFKPLQIGENESIGYSHTYDESKQRSLATITVGLSTRRFFFQQTFNFGVLLGNETIVSLVKETNVWVPHKLADYIASESVDEELRRATLYEFEYAISIATENLAKNIDNLE